MLTHLYLYIYLGFFVDNVTCLKIKGLSVAKRQQASTELYFVDTMGFASVFC
jgi:hypothetical protein